jgi:Undecaprenyl-phosphate glucose phosphotransferase
MLYASPHMDSRHMPLASKYTALFGWGLRLADLGVIVVAGVLAYWLRFGNLEVPLDYERTIARGFMFALLVFSASPLYRSWRGRGLASELVTMAVTYAVLFVLVTLYAVALKYAADLSRLWRGLWFIGSVLGGVGVRIVIRSAARWTRSRGMDLRSAVVIGDGRDAQRIIQTLQQRAWAGIRVLGCFRPDAAHACSSNGVPCLGDLDALADYVEREHVNQVWIALPMSAQDQINRILDTLIHSTVDVKFVPDLFGLQLLNHSVEQVAGLPVINLRASPFDGEKRLIKALEDRIGAFFIVLLIAPVLALIALGVRLSSPGPILFRQKRHGLGGRVIEVWKFRSMRVHAEEDGKVTQATRHDTRITPFGRFLRHTSLDELPQFFNVLQGTMSIVGPRPHAIAHNHQYKTIVQDYMQRHRVKPGITGWAQVNGLRGETDTLGKMKARVEYDLYYMQNWSVLFDLRIIAMTVATGMFNRNAY